MLESQDLKFKGTGLFYTAEHCQLKVSVSAVLNKSIDFISVEPGLRLNKEKTGQLLLMDVHAYLGQFTLKNVMYSLKDSNWFE